MYGPAPLEDSPFDESSWAGRQLLEVIIADEVESIDGPHVVQCRLVGTDIVSFSGPYPTGLAALERAEKETRSLSQEDPMEYSVFPLLTPSQARGAPR